MKIRLLSALFLILLAAHLAISAQGATPEATPETSTFNLPPEVTDHNAEWPLSNHDYANTRTAIGSTINASNVNTLGLVWTVPILAGGEWGAAAGNPVIAGGVVYFQDLSANTYAVDLKTGKSLWTTVYNNAILGPGGVGIGYGKVFIVSRVDQFSALDINSGHEVWTYPTGNQLPSGAIQPVAFDNQVYITTQAGVGGQGQVTFQGYQGGASGVIFALNPQTGSLNWKWQVVEAGFWGHPDINSGGGLWYPPGIDLQTGAMYWGTGNPAPFPGLAGYPNGASRPGDNLYTDSLVALDHSTGKLLWYNQVTRHDLYDHDFQISPMLASITSGGAPQNIVIGSGKAGHIIAFDRDKGNILWNTAVGIHVNDTLTEFPPGQTVWAYPGVWGGVETPMAYADGTIYALVTNLPSPLNATGWDATNGTDAVNRVEGATVLKNGAAEVDALDAATGKILWKTNLSEVAFGSVTVVNNLIFTAMLDGTIYALSRSDGTIVWQYKAPGGINAWPAVAGDTIVWPVGIGDGPVLIALRLGANLPTATPQEQKTPVGVPSTSR